MDTVVKRCNDHYFFLKWTEADGHHGSLFYYGKWFFDDFGYKHYLDVERSLIRMAMRSVVVGR